MGATVTIEEQGREGRVTYREGLHAIAGSQEFGGGDVVAIVSMGSAEDWRARHPWALDRRSDILRFVAAEVVRQRAPSCAASIDAATGDIVLRRGGASPAADPRAAAAAWVHRYGTLKAWLGVGVLVVGLVAAAVVWVGSRVLSIDPGTGIPFGSVVRTDTHLAVLIDRLQPYVPSLRHDPSTERRSLGVFLVPLDGSAPRLVPLVRDLRPGSYSLSRVIGDDGRRLWIDANGPIAVDLRTGAIVTDRDAAPPPRTPRLLSNPPHTTFMAAGLFAGPDTWLGLQSAADLSAAYRPGRWLRPVESASDTSREMRRLVRGSLGPADGDGTHRQIRAMAPLDPAEYRNASFLRLAQASEPLRLAGPDSVLMLHAGAGPRGTLLVSRVQVESARLLWTQDTGIDRFTLQQILPAERSTAFVGTRPPVPDAVSEPLIVILDHATGRLASHSLWR